MRFLHTADWHLGDRLGRIDRTEDLRRRVEQIANYCRDEAIDVLIVAGDIFSELARPDGLREAVRHLQTTFECFLRGGGTILAVSGNHDNENFCETLRHAMTLAAPSIGGFGEVIPPGRLYLTADPWLARLADRKTGELIQFVMLPFPTPSRYLTNEALQKYRSFEQKNQFLQAAFTRRLGDIRADRSFDPRLPTVLIAHVSVQGADLTERFRVSASEDVVTDVGSLISDYAYVALGHIHKPQILGGCAHVRYSGSLDCLDVGERFDRKCIVIFELGSRGLKIAPVTIELQATPIYDIEIHDPAKEMPTLCERYPDHESALANIHVHYTAGVDSLESVLRELDAVFPRWYARDWTERGSLRPSLSPRDALKAKGFGETVREYLEMELQDQDDRQTILDLAEELLQEKV